MEQDKEWGLWTQKMNRSDFEGLISLKKQFFVLLDQRLQTDWMDKNLCMQINRFHRHLFLRVIRLSMDVLHQQGREIPAVPFAFVLFGSGGRGELSCRSDQDHGLIYGTGGKEKPEADEYFVRLFTLVTDGLSNLGYPLCDGNVLATNQKWRLSLSEWKKMIDGWFEDMDWDQVRYFTIAADMNNLFGDSTLVDELRSYFIDKIKKCPLMVGRLYENAQGKRVPLGWFGQILTERYGNEVGAFSVKQGIYLPIIKSVRIFALNEGIASSSTFQRITQLVEKGVWSEAYGHQLTELLLKVLTLRNGCPERFHISTPDYVKLSPLAKAEIMELKEMLKQVKNLQRSTEQFVKRNIRE
jgi:CBS domain-containing protein